MIKYGKYYLFTLNGESQIGEAKYSYIKFANHKKNNPIMIAMHKAAPDSNGIFPAMAIQDLPPFLKKAGITYKPLPSMKVFPRREECISYCGPTNTLLVPGAAPIDLSEKTPLTRFILDDVPIQETFRIGDNNLYPSAEIINGRPICTKIGCQTLTPDIMNNIRAFIAKHSKPIVKKQSSRTKQVKDNYLNIKPN